MRSNDILLVLKCPIQQGLEIKIKVVIALGRFGCSMESLYKLGKGESMKPLHCGIPLRHEIHFASVLR